jgi:presequence protease
MPSKKRTHFNTVGKKYQDFVVLKSIEITELQCQLIELIHEPTGAQVMYLSNDDPENLFCLSFQTLPMTSNGVAHILEHTVLCGSEKYPVKDPFFAMSRRSLNTFMNALTGSDFTCYPASTQVPKDFYNLLEVYLDATFKPTLNELSFLQEGHRLEFSIPDDPTSPLEHKGVVFNEMKGAMASGSARMSEAIHQALYPDLTYGINSGGDPKVIPELTYEALVDFHKKFYHPSRCLFYFYGNMPLEEHLDFITEHALKGVEKLPPLPPIPKQTRFQQPKKLEFSYPISQDDDIKDQSIISFSWLTCDILEQQTLLALSILEIILMDTDASPLKMALLRSGLCKQAGSYIDVDNTEIPFVIILKGCSSNDAQKIEDIIFSTLKSLAYNGIPLFLLENAMHQLEFFRSEITGDHSPFGLSLFMRSGLLKQHGAEPESGLRIHSLFESLRKLNLENPRYFSELITKYLIENNHFVRIVLNPDQELSTKELEEEKLHLETIKSALSKKQAQGIIEKTKALAQFQKAQEEETDVDFLPKVALEDIPKNSRNFALTQEHIGNLEIFHHTCFTNKIVYVDLIFNLPALKEEDLPLVRLFTLLLSQMGCGGRNYIENLEYIQANTGGVGASLTLNLKAEDYRTFHPALSIRGKALNPKAKKLFTLIHEMVNSVDFSDILRLKEVILKHYTALQSSLSQNSLKYAINLSASGLDVSSKISNAWYGLEYYWMIKELAQNFDERAKGFVHKLNELQNKLLGLDNPQLILTCDALIYDEIKGNEFYGLQNMLTKPYEPFISNYNLPSVYPQGRIISSPIAFTSMVFQTVSYVHPDAPALNVSSFLMDNLTLHTRIREQGGAYGGGAVSNVSWGHFYFYSYRDPNISSTLQAFNDSVKNIVNGNFSESDLQEAKLEMIQSLDSPISPGSRGDRAFGWICEGKSLEIRQAFRDKLLGLTKKEVIGAVKRHVLPNMKKGVVVVFAGKELLEKENAMLREQGKEPLKIESI